MKKRDKHAPIWRFQLPYNNIMRLSIANGMLLMMMVIGSVVLSTVEATATAVVTPSETVHFDYKCFSQGDEGTPVSSLSLKPLSIGLLVSDNVVHQMISRIFAIFIREKLNYHNISLVPMDPNTYPNNALKLNDELKLITEHPVYPKMNMINMNVWMPAMGHAFIPLAMHEFGPSLLPGRFGWFVPETLVDENSSISMSYEVFGQPMSPDYRTYMLDEELLKQLKENTTFEDEYLNPLCQHRSCCTLLAEHKRDSSFVIAELQELGSYMNVLWLGSQFKQKLQWLQQVYENDPKYQRRRFVVLHWTPSYLINGNISFLQMSMPKCEDYQSLTRSLCRYEMTPVLKYGAFRDAGVAGNEMLFHALKEFLLEWQTLIDILRDLSVYEDAGGTLSPDVYNAYACKWIMDNPDLHKHWLMTDKAINIAIGGIYPKSDPSRGHENLEIAVKRAMKAINANGTLLRGYNLVPYENDGECKADVVMKVLIHYYNDQHVLGVLGPACSETVEPIAGISKHLNMAIISYSAEGASFLDRQAYPNFFRTIGSNRQYKDVYISLMKQMGWRRVAALTEDGQKYTEYISHMETAMKQHNLELIVNKKFLSDVTPSQMNKHLLDLKYRHAKIIIADIHNKYAIMAMCEAYKLKMTAYDGYVWFFPSWISKSLKSLGDLPTGNSSCSKEALRLAFEGHFTVMHTPFGEDTSLMQENITVRQWVNDTALQGDGVISNYAGFAYDAVWAYAYAADRIFKENKDSVSDFHSKEFIKRFVEIIWQTDFDGVSGKVRFGEGGSRITDVDIKQWQHTKFVDIGKFHPDVMGLNSKLHTNGGQLVLQADAISWLGKGQGPPDDGTYDCGLSQLAQLMGTNCDTATLIFTAVFCFLAVVLVSFVSFLFWKRRYNRKMKESARIMKNFGIDLLSPSRNKENTLDKWEIPKENVVINRRLGEGAFGTVYGGEARLDLEVWTAVAVKTLKAGAATADRLDFLSEAEAMKRLDHKNIIKLLGVCLQSEPIYTIMEFMLYGDLKTYLLARRHLVNDKLSDDSDISAKRLSMYAMDISKGLAYLARQKYVHRDLACRNCLVNAERVVKLGDFGMARSTFESDYYRFSHKGMLPVRWMAPESLGLGIFTPASDVWAFGVVLYEIITFGSFPYQGLTNNQAMEYIKSGKTLQIPAGVKPPLEALIKACWSQEAKKRPAASEIVKYITNYPRLLTPCLDFPGSAVQMPETESDEIEILPKLRKSSPDKKKDSTLDILAQTSGASACTQSSDLNYTDIEDDDDDDDDDGNTPTPPKQRNANDLRIEMPPTNLSDLQGGSSIHMNTFSQETPDGYSVMSPLLTHQMHEHAVGVAGPSGERAIESAVL